MAQNGFSGGKGKTRGGVKETKRGRVGKECRREKVVTRRFGGKGARGRGEVHSQSKRPPERCYSKKSHPERDFPEKRMP